MLDARCVSAKLQPLTSVLSPCQGERRNNGELRVNEHYLRGRQNSGYKDSLITANTPALQLFELAPVLGPFSQTASFIATSVTITAFTRRIVVAIKTILGPVGVLNRCC